MPCMQSDDVEIITIRYMFFYTVESWPHIYFRHLAKKKKNTDFNVREPEV